MSSDIAKSFSETLANEKTSPLLKVIHIMGKFLIVMKVHLKDLELLNHLVVHVILQQINHFNHALLVP